MKLQPSFMQIHKDVVIIPGPAAWYASKVINLVS